jgi:hypothetical protein
LPRTVPPESVSSDPISPYSSSPRKEGVPLTVKSPTKAVQVHESEDISVNLPRPYDDDDEEELPDLNVALAKEKTVREQERKKKELLEMKARLAAQAKNQSVEYSDDDLQVDGPTSIESTKRVTGRRPPYHIAATVGRPKGEYSSSLKAIFGNNFKHQRVDHNNYSRMLEQMARAESTKLAKAKDAEWAQRGGRVDANVSEHQMMDVVKSVAQQALEHAHRRQIESPNADDSDDTQSNGGDYTNESDKQFQGTPPDANDTLVGEADESWAEDITMVDEDPKAAEEDDKPPKVVANTRRRVVDSDSEEDENTHKKGKILVPDTSMSIDEDSLSTGLERPGSASSFEEHDKENRSVVRRGFSTVRPIMGTRQSTLHGLEDRQARLSMRSDDSPLRDEHDSDGENVQPLFSKPEDEEGLFLDVQPLNSEGTPSGMLLPRRSTKPLLGQSSSSSSSFLDPSPCLKPVLGRTSSLSSGSPLQLGGGFSQLFESGTEKQSHNASPKNDHSHLFDDETQQPAARPFTPKKLLFGRTVSNGLVTITDMRLSETPI